MRGVVHRVHEAERAGVAGQRGRVGNIGDRTQRVGCRPDSDQPGAGRDGGLQRRPVELAALRQEGNHAQGDAALPGQRAPGRDIGVVVQLGDDDLVARPPGTSQRPPEMEGERRHVRPKGDIVRRRAQEVGQGAPGPRQHGVGLFAAGIAPVGVRIVVVEVVHHGVADRGGHLSPARSIEVGDRLSPVLTVKRGKSRSNGPDFGELGRGGGRGSRHGNAPVC